MLLVKCYTTTGLYCQVDRPNASPGTELYGAERTHLVGTLGESLSPKRQTSESAAAGNSWQAARDRVEGEDRRFESVRGPRWRRRNRLLRCLIWRVLRARV